MSKGTKNYKKTLAKNFLVNWNPANSNPQLQDNINHIWNKEEETPMQLSPGLEHLPLTCSSSILSELLEAPNPTLETL